MYANIRPVAKVLVIYTGGTIGMLPSDPENPASPLRAAGQDRLVEFIPNPLQGGTPRDGIEWTIQGLTDERGAAVGPLDSSSVGPRHWVLMANAIQAGYDSYDGFVILHGTDTMAFTASALSFLLQNLNKPVVITGSQLPIFHPRTDAKLNFVNSLFVAGYRASRLPKISEVIICFGEHLLRGNRTTKVSTTGYQGFASPNYRSLGKVGEYITIEPSLLLPPPSDSSPFFAHNRLEENVATIPLYPGMDPSVLRVMLSIDVKGIILRTFGTGNAPESGEFIATIAEAVSQGKLIVNTTQCLEGTVEMGLYEASSGLQSAGVITGLDLTPEAALTKLMWLLATEAPHEVATQMQINLRGEQSGSVFDTQFGPVGTRGRPQDVARMSARPAGQFRTGSLTRAVLRLEGVGIHGAISSNEIQFRVFVNLPSADMSTSEGVPQFAGHLSGIHRGDGETTLVLEIGDAVARVHETGRSINITLVSINGLKFWAKALCLTLFNEL